MMPTERNDYSAYIPLDTMLEDRRVRDTKYSGARQKRLKIAIGYGNVFHASAGFLQMLREKYGGKTTFNDALAAWEGR